MNEYERNNLNKEIQKDMITSIIAKTLYETRRWSFNVMGDEYIEQMHNRTKETDYGDYAIGKFKMMQKNFGDWYASLDGTHRRRLSKIIYERIYNKQLTRCEKWDKEEK